MVNNMEPGTKRGVGRPRNIPEPESVIDDTRDPPRPELRDSDPREAAVRRAKEIRDQLGDSIEQPDEFFIPPHLKDPDWDYNWKTYSVHNAHDPHYINELHRTGWQFVPANRPGFEFLLPTGWKEKIVLKKGQVLMERPMEISMMIERRQEKAAKERLEIQERRMKSEPIRGAPIDNDGKPIGMGMRRTIAGPIPD